MGCFIISLYVKEDLRTAVILTYEDPKISLAFRTLANLANLYATTGPTGQFYLFRDIVNWRLGGGEPSAEIAHLVELFAQLSGAGLVLPDNLKAMLLCTGLGDNYASLVTTAVHTIGTTEFTPAKLIPMILAESRRQSTSLANRIAPASSSKGQTIKKASPSIRCKICQGSSHTTEDCWKLTGKPGSKTSGNQTNNTQQQQQQQKPGNQGSGGKKKGKGCGQGKKDKGKGKAHETHVADTAMIIDIDSEAESGDSGAYADDEVSSDVTWTPEYAAPNLLLDKPGESSTLAVTAICVDEEVLDWGDDNDDGMGTFSPIPNQSFRRMSF